MKLTFTQLRPPGGELQQNYLKHLLVIAVFLFTLVPMHLFAQTPACSVTTLNITGSASGGNSNKGLAGNFGTPTTPPPTLGTYTITLYRVDENGNYTDPFSRPNNVTLNIVGNNWEVYANGAQNIPGGSYVAIYEPNADQNCTVKSVTSGTYCHVTSQIKTLAAAPRITTTSLFTTSTTVSGTSTDASGTVALFVNGNLALKADGVSGYKTSISNNAWTIDITGITLKAGDVVAVRAITNTSCLSDFSNSINVYDNTTGKTATPAITGTYCAPVSPQNTTLTLTGTGIPSATITLYNDGTANTTAPADAIPLVTNPATVTVAADGSWSATVNGINAGYTIKAIAKTTTQTQSDYSAKANLNAQPIVKNVSFSPTLVCSGGTVNATVFSSEPGVTYQLLDNGVATGNPVVGTGGDINVITGTLNANASLRVRATYGTAACDVLMPATPFAVTVTSPNSRTINYSNQTICSGGSVTATVVNSELNVNYQLYINFKPVGSLVAGTGSDITFNTGPLTADANLNVEATKTDGLGCKAFLSQTWFNVTVYQKQSTDGLVITFPVLTKDRKVTGTFPTDGAKVNVFIDNNFLGTATVAAGAWALTNLRSTELYDGGVIYASVSQSNTCESDKVEGPVVGNTVLPVELLYFTGKRDNGKINLVWSTATEKNNSHFEVERSSNGVDFKEIGRVTGAGNSLAVQKYSFTDKAPFAGITYYRLKQVDFNTGSEYSKIIAVNGSAKVTSQEILAYPNPTSGQLSVVIKATATENYTLEVSDLVGRVVMVKDVAVNTQTTEAILDVQHLPAGTYLVTARSKDINLVTRIIKK